MDGYIDWVKEHVQEVCGSPLSQAAGCRLPALTQAPRGAPLNESDHCGDPPLLLAAGNGALTSCLWLAAGPR